MSVCYNSVDLYGKKMSHKHWYNNPTQIHLKKVIKDDAVPKAHPTILTQRC